MQGKFIVVEGIEGAGKSTAIAIIADELSKHSITQLKFTREPGGTPIAEKIRQLLKATNPEEPLMDKTELLLMYAARAQLVDSVIKPALQQGIWVIGDRHDLSSHAYQGGGRGISASFIRQLGQLVLDDFRPDLIFYLDIPPEQGLQRAGLRGELDRFELESLQFFTRVRASYQQLIANDVTVKTIDATQTMLEVEKSIRQVLIHWLYDLKG